jgi:pseudoazurin
MKRILASAAALALLTGSAAFAEMHEVKMLNKGPDGESMVFEPAFLQVAPGDTVKFLATDKGHNAESLDGMVHEGAEGFNGRINEEIEVTLDIAGLYGVQCKPHDAMGMVMTIAVGEVETAPDDFLEGRIPPRSKERFEAQLGNL